MAITILPPVVDDVDIPSDSDDSMSVDSDGGVGIAAGRGSRSGKQSGLAGVVAGSTGIVTPGEVVTDDPQWMRSVSPMLGVLQLQFQWRELTYIQRTRYIHEPSFDLHHRHRCRECSENQQIAFGPAYSSPLQSGDR